MKIDKNFFLTLSLFFGFGLVILGVFAKISHWLGADAIMISGVIITLIYTLAQYTIIYRNNAQIQTQIGVSDILISASYAMGTGFSIYTTYLKTNHLHFSIVLLVISVLSTIVFILLALNEILRSTRIKKSEKIMWTICIILLSSLSGFVYIVAARKQIIPVSQQ
jgi:hypothetical protein